MSVAVIVISGGVLHDVPVADHGRRGSDAAVVGGDGLQKVHDRRQHGVLVHVLELPLVVTWRDDVTRGGGLGGGGRPAPGVADLLPEFLDVAR